MPSARNRIVLPVRIAETEVQKLKRDLATTPEPLIEGVDSITTKD
jgi:hypothetical protein